MRVWSGNDGKIFYERDGQSIKMTIKEPLKQKYFDVFLGRIESYLGYSPAHISTPNGNAKYDYNTVISLLDKPPFAIYFDAKYDQELSQKDIPPLIYHVSPSIHEEKILKIGLVAKSKNKLSAHPERIYLGISEDATMGLLKDSKFTKGISEFTLYEVNHKKLELARTIRFFADPIYPNKAFYTYENIPPQYLKVVRRIKIEQ
jgi:hypothetical protein